MADGNVGVAFALVIGAGLCTTLGAAFAFWARLASPKTLAVGLGLSAGVMIYVSFVEIFMQKGVAELSISKEEGGWGEDGGYRYGTLLLFGGVLVTALLDLLVHFISVKAGGSSTTRSSSDGTDSATSDLKKASEAADDLEAGRDVKEDIPNGAAKTIETLLATDEHRFGLQKMGLLTALAIGIHNLPEGLATFIAALSDPLNGVAIAVAIALHNIPEGVCVAMPVYYATGSRMKGFLWAFLSGLSEPIGGLLGWIILRATRSADGDSSCTVEGCPVVYGVLFCMVAGMMIYISVVQLVPTALKYDPENQVVAKSVMAGMVVMAASLLAFTF